MKRSCKPKGTAGCGSGVETPIAQDGTDTLVRMRATYAGMETSAIADEYARHRRTREQTVDVRIKAYTEKLCRDLARLIADREGLDCTDRDHGRKGRANWGKHRPSPRGVITPAPRRGRK